MLRRFFPIRIILTSSLLLMVAILTGACSGTIQAVDISPTSTQVSTASSAPEVTRVVEKAASPTAASALVKALRDTPTPPAPPPAEEPDTPTPTLTPTRTPFSPDDWQDLPVVPYVSENARAIYQRGLARGRDPHAFSKVGDCQNITTYFLANFDKPGRYNLGSEAYLQETIDWYTGSFSRESLSVRGGFNAAAMLSPLRADPKQCEKGDNPLSCELRLNNPSIALISLEEWWAGQPENYEKYMRKIIEYTLQEDVLPILATKADNLEGEHAINQTLARLAWEYDIPIWNFWRAVQPLSSHGLVEDGFHLTYGDIYEFQLPLSEWTGWTMRNLTALQVLHGVRTALAEGQ